MVGVSQELLGEATALFRRGEDLTHKSNQPTHIIRLGVIAGVANLSVG